jgi:hypothetical protein
MSLLNDIQDFSSLISIYSAHKAGLCYRTFEGGKKNITKKIIRRRGQLSRPTVHLGMAGIAAGVLVGGGLIGGNTLRLMQLHHNRFHRPSSPHL